MTVDLTTTRLKLAMAGKAGNQRRAVTGNLATAHPKMAGKVNNISLSNNKDFYHREKGLNLSHELALRCDISFLSSVCSRNLGLTRWSEPSSPVASLRTFIDKSFTM